MIFGASIPVLFLIAIAAAPGIFLLRLIRKLDKVDKESPRLIISIILLEIPFLIAAIVLESIGSAILIGVLRLKESSLIYTVLYCFLVIGPTEEICKMLGALLPAWKSREFNCRYDGIVYCTASALSFGILENIMYVLFSPSHLSTALFRAFTSIPMHFMLGVCMGMFVGRAKVGAAYGDAGTRNKNMLIALIIPAVIHAFYDTICLSTVPILERVNTAGDSEAIGLFLIMLLMIGIMIVFIIAVYIFLFVALRRESKNDFFFAEPMPGWVPKMFRNNERNE